MQCLHSGHFCVLESSVSTFVTFMCWNSLPLSLSISCAGIWYLQFELLDLLKSRTYILTFFQLLESTSLSCQIVYISPMYTCIHVSTGFIRSNVFVLRTHVISAMCFNFSCQKPCKYVQFQSNMPFKRQVLSSLHISSNFCLCQNDDSNSKT